MRKPPPISTSSPRATMTSLRDASAARASNTAAALLFTTTASSAAARSARRRAACPCRSPRFPATRSYSTVTAPAAAAIAASARGESGARPRFVCRTTPVALITLRRVRRSRSARAARVSVANLAASPVVWAARARARNSRVRDRSADRRGGSHPPKAMPVAGRRASPCEDLEGSGADPYREALRGGGLAVQLRPERTLELDLDHPRALHHDLLSVDVRAAIELAERDDRGPAREIACEKNVELTVVERGLRRDVHARTEMRAVRGDDGEESAGVKLAVHEHAHGLRPIRPDPDERAREVTERLADEP